MLRRTLAAALCLSAVLAAPAAPAGTFTQDPCPEGLRTPSLFARSGSDVLENLGFDDRGSMWVSNSSANRVQEYLPSGAPGRFFGLTAPGALTLAADGRMFANFGDSAVGSLAKTGAAGVAWFDPESPNPRSYTIVSGLDMANGGIFDGAGNYYASNDFGVELTKMNEATGVDAAWTAAADVYGTNGLVVVGDTLYAAITFDQRSSIEAIPLANPAAHSTLVETTFGVATLEPAVDAEPEHGAPLIGLKGLDDMTLGPDGRLYVVANGMGELLRVDVATREACLVASGLQNPSSVRFAPTAFGGAWVAYVTEFSGAIRRLDLS